MRTVEAGSLLKKVKNRTFQAHLAGEYFSNFFTLLARGSIVIVPKFVNQFTPEVYILMKKVKISYPDVPFS